MLFWKLLRKYKFYISVRIFLYLVFFCLLVFFFVLLYVVVVAVFVVVGFFYLSRGIKHKVNNDLLFLACTLGYFGNSCNTPCPTGTFGLQCAGRCPPLCSNDNCHHMYGCSNSTTYMTKALISGIKKTILNVGSGCLICILNIL